MAFYKQFDNGLRLVVNKMDGFLSVTAGILVKTGSINEESENNGISHFIEHCVFKGTKKRTSFDISNDIDKIGAQINAFTSKETTCFYTKSTKEHLEESLDVLSDIFFNATFEKAETDKEKAVVIEEIKMGEDTPEDLCLDVLATSMHGDIGLGRTILGSEKNVKSFTKFDIESYMDKYYTADNTVISIAGNIEVEKAVELVEKMFAVKFTRIKSAPQKTYKDSAPKDLYKIKKIEQAHIAFSFPSFSVLDPMADAFNIASIIFGGGMSSRLFQTVREQMGLAYTVYSYPSQYKDRGVMEIYAGVNTESRDLATKAIIDEIIKFKEEGVTKEEFLRGKEQLKSSIILGKENTASQMLLYAKYLLFLNKEFDFNERINQFDAITIEDVNKAIKMTFDISKMATATVGTKRSALKIKR